jgi:hypothetical protein
MTSQIETILDEIAVWAPVYDTETVTCWNIDAVRENLEPMQVPRRILGLADDSAFSFVALGKRGTITWIIQDTLYIAPTGELAVFRRHYGDMIRYAASYTNAALSDRSLTPNAQAHVVGVTFSSGTFAWPEGSDNLFLGVRAEVEVQEII